MGPIDAACHARETSNPVEGLGHASPGNRCVGELDESAHEGGEDGGHLVDDGTAGPHADTHQVSRHSLYHAN